jgi:hydrogenase maturation protein HypF
VGFRPFVYRQAVALGLAGSVCNDSDGVLIDVEGDSASIAELGRRLVDEAPPLARIQRLSTEAAEPTRSLDGFRIVASDDAGVANVPVGIDSATCGDCLAETEDPSDRRYRYAFTN